MQMMQGETKSWRDKRAVHNHLAKKQDRQELNTLQGPVFFYAIDLCWQ